MDTAKKYIKEASPRIYRILEEAQELDHAAWILKDYAAHIKQSKKPSVGEIKEALKRYKQSGHGTIGESDWENKIIKLVRGTKR